MRKRIGPGYTLGCNKKGSRQKGQEVMQSVEQLWDAMETKDLTELVSILNKQRMEDNAIHELYHPEELEPCQEKKQST